MSGLLEPRLVYNHLDDKYYIYEGETYVSDTDSLPMALQYFLALVEGNVQQIGDNKWLYGPVIQIDRR